MSAVETFTVTLSVAAWRHVMGLVDADAHSAKAIADGLRERGLATAATMYADEAALCDAIVKSIRSAET